MKKFYKEQIVVYVSGMSSRIQNKRVQGQNVQWSMYENSIWDNFIILAKLLFSSSIFPCPNTT